MVSREILSSVHKLSLSFEEALKWLSNRRMDVLPETGKPSEVYIALNITDLGDLRSHGLDGVKSTLDSYSNHAERYGEIELDEEQIIKVLKDYADQFLRLKGKKGNILLGGVGFGRDALLAALFNLSIKVEGYDVVEEMIEGGLRSLTPANIEKVLLALIKSDKEIVGDLEIFLELSEILTQANNEVNELVERLGGTLGGIKTLNEEGGLVMIEALKEQFNGMFSVLWGRVINLISEPIIKSVPSRLKLKIANHIDFHGEPGSYIWIFDNATLQHLKRNEQLLAIAKKAALLDLDAEYDFNLRYDSQPATNVHGVYVFADKVTTLGRVMCDNRLNPFARTFEDSGWRFYTTNSEEEIHYLIEAIESGLLFKRMNIPIPAGAKYTVLNAPKFSNAKNPGSPGFVDLTIKRVA